MAPPRVQQGGHSVPPPRLYDQFSPQVGVQSVPQATASSASRVLTVKVFCRVMTLAMTLASLVILITNHPARDLKFSEVHAYIYMLSVSLLALVYSLLQTVLSVVQLTSGNPVKSLAFLDFYGDIVILYALATGAAAGFAATFELQRFFHGKTIGRFFEKGNESASMLILSSACSIVTLVLSR